MVLATIDLMSVANLAVSGVIAVATWYINSKTSKIDELEKSLKASSERSIEEKFAGVNQTCSMKHEIVARELAAINERLGRGDAEFDHLGEGGHRLEIKLVAAIGDLKETMLRECAGREELADLQQQVNAMAARFAAMEKAIAMDIENSRREAAKRH